MTMIDKLKNSALMDRLRHWTWLYEIRIWKDEYRRFKEEAENRFAQPHPGGSMDDYLKALRRHRVTFQEYMYGYEYWKLDEAGRDAFISRSAMQSVYRKLVDGRVRCVFNDKVRFLQEYADFIHRRWALATTLTVDQFREMATATDLIAKPIVGTCGEGIFKIIASEVDDWNALYIKCINGKYLLEECVHACDEIDRFHPSSLNTIRVVTISGNGQCEVVGALLRTGAHGSFVDNTHAGGVFAPIDPATGRIEMDGIDSESNCYMVHPDTGVRFKGFEIPHWEDIVETCKKACSVLPDIRFAGWDLTVLPDGRVEIIEGNHAPDVDGGLQAPKKRGIKQQLRETVMRVIGVDMLDYIGITNRTLNGYNFFDSF